VTPHAATRLAKAEAFLAQLGKVSAEAAPAAAIHLAYYAMLHAATAVLLEKTGDAPKTHAGTIGQFSRAVLDDEQGRRFGRALGRAEQLRLVSDYDDQAAPTETDAKDLSRVAVDFVSYCRSLL
jgi:uncharacterized protein (UPF0332 family)